MACELIGNWFENNDLNIRMKQFSNKLKCVYLCFVNYYLYALQLYSHSQFTPHLNKLYIKWLLINLWAEKEKKKT